MSAPAGPARMSVDEAVARARRANPALLAQRASARASAQAPLDATRSFLPTLRLDVGGLRTTDPVAVFGSKLRQEAFASEDLALDALIRPGAYSGFATTATLEIPLFVPSGIFGYGAARRGAEAASAVTDRAAGATELVVTQAYWDAQLAAASLQALEDALASAEAHAGQAEALHAQGLVTGLDARLARLAVAEVEARRLGAAAAADNARSALLAMLALPDDTPLELTDSLTVSTHRTCAGPDACQVADRADVRARRLGLDAATLGVRSAWAKNLPSVAAFGSASRYGASAPWGSGSGDWTIGIGLSWSPFAALSGVGAVRKAQAERAEAEALLADAERRAELESVQALRTLEAAAGRVSVAAAAWTEAQEALGQARTRYRTGVAPISELLDVQAAATATRLSLLTAQRDHAVAGAALDFAYGAFDR
ncbi:MAG: TolC family protein [Gemmatimonadales bacterium]